MENDLKFKKPDLLTFKKLIQKYAFNGGIDARDVLQEYECCLLEGKALNQKPKYFVIDYLRKHNADKRYLSNNVISQFEERGQAIVGGLPRFKLSSGQDYFEYGKFIKGRDKIVFNLFYRWGINETEISNIFGVSLSRVSQRVKRISERIRKKIKKEKQREKKISLEEVLREKTKREWWGVELFKSQEMEIGSPFGVEKYF